MCLIGLNWVISKLTREDFWDDVEVVLTKHGSPNHIL